MKIKLATPEDLDSLSDLFNQYRIFYNQDADLSGCKEFISERLNRAEAIVYLAESDEGRAVGFTLLYSTFSSVSLARIFVLNDLYVHPDFRRRGIGAQLMKKAVVLAKSHGAVRLHLETERSNHSAQLLYAKEGWIKENDTYHYNYTL